MIERATRREKAREREKEREREVERVGRTQGIDQCSLSACIYLP